MSENEQLPTTETVANAAQVVTNTESTTEEAFDKERAMATIHSLREIEKKAKQDAKELAQLKAEKQQKLDAELSETERLKKQAEEAQKQAIAMQAEESGLPAPLTAEERLKAASDAVLTANENLINHALK